MKHTHVAVSRVMANDGKNALPVAQNVFSLATWQPLLNVTYYNISTI